ncbi:MAG: type II toxin-antitoxin system RelE/ParE family toxin [Planctomycetes bacterium]|nr:type II toxin-antitoxin system RelE/ParE family toxin [Planctomycetota bacterium]
MWEIEYTDAFDLWWETLSEDDQDSIVTSVELLRQLGPSLPRPYADTLKGSRHSNMKELRSQSKGRPLRTFFAFDPRRSAVLLIGGDKTGDDRFYKKMIPIADDLFDNHLDTLKKEGLP